MGEAARFLGFNSHGFPQWYLDKGYAKGWKISLGELEPSYNDITGMKFGRLTALYPEETNVRGRFKWICRCDCGKYTKANSSELKSGTRFSCGCARETHGMSKTRLYIIWNDMKQRCNYPQLDCYKNYGGRGISYCDEWEKFEPFAKWALANGYADDLTLDRIDNNGNYSPENCRWTTKEMQDRNKRTNRYITFNGETHTIGDWASMTGIDRTVIAKRLDKGMPVEEALTKSADTRKPLVAIDEKTGVIYWFESSKDAERRGHTRPAIWRALTGEYKTHHGLVWKYAGVN